MKPTHLLVAALLASCAPSQPTPAARASSGGEEPPPLQACVNDAVAETVVFLALDLRSTAGPGSRRVQGDERDAFNQRCQSTFGADGQPRETAADGWTIERYRRVPGPTDQRWALLDPQPLQTSGGVMVRQKIECACEIASTGTAAKE